MILPVGTVGRSKFRPYVTFTLVVINVLAYVLELIVMSRGEPAMREFFNTYALSVCRLQTDPVLLTLRNATFTMFLHGGPLHLLFNMVFLWIFAPRVEEFFGHKRFLGYYLLVGLIASMAHVVMAGVQCPVGKFGDDIMVGASGAIAGVMGAFFWLHPGAKVRTLVVFRIFALPAFLYLIVWVGMDIFSMITQPNNGIAHWAHIGGFFAGIAVLFVVTMFVPAPRGNPLEHLDA